MVGAVGEPVLAGLGLREGMRAVFEEPGVLHRHLPTTGRLGSRAGGVATGTSWAPEARIVAG